jgi:hypothetical protein
LRVRIVLSQRLGTAENLTFNLVHEAVYKDNHLSDRAEELRRSPIGYFSLVFET